MTRTLSEEKLDVYKGIDCDLEEGLRFGSLQKCKFVEECFESPLNGLENFITIFVPFLLCCCGMEK